ncbi:MAG: hypothetical protein ACI85K_001910, partial [Hyphomicrobiaceae bacterium]
MVRLPFLIHFACALTLAVLASAQDDLRDRITLTNGRVITGRIATPHDPDQLLVMQGGKRVRVDVALVKETQLVADQLIEFFKRRDQHGKS